MGWDGWEPSDDDSVRGLKEADIIGRLVDDPAAIPEFIVARGLLGRSSTPNVWRVYTNIHLTEFVEVAADQIVFAEAVDDVATVWIRGDAPFAHKIRADESESTYIDGAILRGVLDDGRPDFGLIPWDERALAEAKVTKCPRCPRQSY